MKMKMIIKIIGWFLLITLGVIHFLNREDLSVLNSGSKGFMYNVAVIVALGLVAFSSSAKKMRESKAGMVLISTGFILFLVGLIWSGLKGYDTFLFFIFSLAMIMIIISDFIALRMEAKSEKDNQRHEAIKDDA